jgi:hypothetical protein
LVDDSEVGKVVDALKAHVEDELDSSQLVKSQLTLVVRVDWLRLRFNPLKFFREVPIAFSPLQVTTRTLLGRAAIEIHHGRYLYRSCNDTGL